MRGKRPRRAIVLRTENSWRNRPGCPLLHDPAGADRTFCLAGSRLGPEAEQALWKLVLRDGLLLNHPGPGDLVRMFELIPKELGCSMDFADASLAAVAQRLGPARVLKTGRSDFETYVIGSKGKFKVIGP